MRLVTNRVVILLVALLMAIGACKSEAPPAGQRQEEEIDQKGKKAKAPDLAKKKVVVDAEPVVKPAQSPDGKVAAVDPKGPEAKSAIATVSQGEKVAVAAAVQAATVAVAEAPSAVGEGEETGAVLQGTEGFFAAAARKSKGEVRAEGALVAPVAGVGLASGGELALGSESKEAEKKITVAFGSPRMFSGGKFDRKKLSEVLSVGPEQLPPCFADDHLESDHHTHLNYVVKVSVGAAGKAVAEVAEDYMGEPRAGACALDIINGWTFPEAEGGEGQFLITMVVRRS